MKGNFVGLVMGGVFLYVSRLMLREAAEKRRAGEPTGRALFGDKLVPGLFFGFLGLVLIGAFFFADS